MKNFVNWSPFRQQDPQQKFAISGRDGQVGATFSWQGVKEKDGGVEVVQDFNAQMPIPANIFGMLFGLKNKIALTNKQGLLLLKQMLEKKETASITIK